MTPGGSIPLGSLAQCRMRDARFVIAPRCIVVHGDRHTFAAIKMLTFKVTWSSTLCSSFGLCSDPPRRLLPW
jgi:hypothetical protein